ncbi:unnamed protein product [Ambrosiozyma monospora]|uniref:Unnamed protein product n=1 Tax=Ambrosiozyma monospora TaxID=43982 RepID=A0ACB5SRJ0_AMBMO|nr:unnamed protein product [Ambrosiozyma monospora]
MSSAQARVDDFNDSHMPPTVLKFKVGMPLTLLSNILPSEGMVNGCRMVLLSFHERYLTCKLITGSHEKEVVNIPLYRFSYDYENIH